MQVEFGDFKVTPRTTQLVNEVLNSNWLTLGPMVERWETLWKETFNYPYCRAINSGTSANFAVALALLELYKPFNNRNKNVIIPALSFIASATPFYCAGFEVRFVDVDTDMNINPDLVEAAMDNNTVAIVAVNLMGTPAKLDKLREIADNAGIDLIVDNCESYGCKYQGNDSLDYADVVTSSHFSAHINFAVEQGSVSTKDQKWDELVWAIRSHGRPNGQHWFDHKYLGLNFKPTDLHAAVGVSTLESFWETFEKRKKNYYRLRESMRQYDDMAYFTEEKDGDTNAPHAFAITLRDKWWHLNPILGKYLNVKGIHAKLNFGTIPNHGAFSQLNISKDQFPVSNMMGAGHHIPVHQYLRDDQLDFMERTIKVFFESIK